LRTSKETGVNMRVRKNHRRKIFQKINIKIIPKHLNLEPSRKNHVNPNTFLGLLSQIGSIPNLPLVNKKLDF